MASLRKLRVLHITAAALVCSLVLAGTARAQTPAQGTLVRLDFEGFGSVYLDLFDGLTPVSASNFVQYINADRYNNTIIHRVDNGLGVIQGGGFKTDWSGVQSFGLIPLEYNRANTRGTISMARFFDPQTTATASSQWFLNLDDNSQVLGPTNDSGYAVFGWVVGGGMQVVDAIADVDTFNYGQPFTQMPLTDYTAEDYAENTRDEAKPHSVKLTNAEVVKTHAGFQNPFIRGDVDNDGQLLARDLLELINEINDNDEYNLTTNFNGVNYWDVNGDNRFSRADLARIITDLLESERNEPLAEPQLPPGFTGHGSIGSMSGASMSASLFLNQSVTLAVVPEPTSMVLAGLAVFSFGAIAVRARRSRRSAK